MKRKLGSVSLKFCVKNLILWQVLLRGKCTLGVSSHPGLIWAAQKHIWREY